MWSSNFSNSNMWSSNLYNSNIWSSNSQIMNLTYLQGPEAMGQGIAIAIKETFNHDIKDVLLVGF